MGLEEKMENSFVRSVILAALSLPDAALSFENREQEQMHILDKRTGWWGRGTRTEVQWVLDETAADYVFPDG